MSDESAFMTIAPYRQQFPRARKNVSQKRSANRPLFPVMPGNNLIQVFARHSNEVEARQTLVVLKREPARPQ